MAAPSSAAACLVLAVVLGACDGEKRPTPAPPTSVAPARASTDATPEDLGPLRSPAPPRLVAIGDLHGDLAAARAALRLAGAIDADDKWIGKDLVVVQTGDQIDRGDRDRAILDLFDRLVDDAKAAGGAVHALNGNHELMNVAGDFRYVTPAAFKEFEGASPVVVGDPRLLQFPEPYRARAAAFVSGGTYAMKLARRPIVAIVGDTVFVHGGVLPAHLRYGLVRLDREVRAWLDGSSKTMPAAAREDESPVWTRRFSDRPTPRDCELLGEALAGMGARRMVVGHTVQKAGINETCDGRVWRIDVGMSSFYGGKAEVLEITGSTPRVLRASSP